MELTSLRRWHHLGRCREVLQFSGLPLGQLHDLRWEARKLGHMDTERLVARALCHLHAATKLHKRTALNSCTGLRLKSSILD